MTSDLAVPERRISLAHDLRTQRQRVGLTQRELAGLASCSLASVANMEHGYVPRSGTVLGRVLGVLATYDERRAEDAQPAAVEDREDKSRHAER